MNWNKAVLAEAETMVRSGMSYHDVSRIVSKDLGEEISGEGLRSAVRRYRKSYGIAPERCPRNAPKTFEKSLYVKSKCFLMMADLHIPYHSPEMLEHVRDMIQLYHVDDVILLGDTINSDQVSGHKDGGRKTDFNDDLKLVGDVLLWLGEYTQRIIITSGNHDQWATRKLGADLTLSGLIHYGLNGRRPNAELLITERDYVYINDDWLAGHALSTSKAPGGVALNLANRFKKNVVVGHAHVQNFCSNEDGTLLCVSLGSMISTDERGESPLWYKERRLSSYAPIANGFMIVKNSVPILFNKYGTSCLSGNIPWNQM